MPEYVWTTFGWPRWIRNLFDRVRPELVWHVGMNDLGYPPTWICSLKEGGKVFEKLGV